jgi:hypothetical protein
MRRNWPALELFRAALTQWRYAGISGVPTGLDYQGVEAAARLAAIETTPDMFRRLRVLERAAIDAIAEQQRD